MREIINTYKFKGGIKVLVLWILNFKMDTLNVDLLGSKFWYLYIFYDFKKNKNTFIWAKLLISIEHVPKFLSPPLYTN